MVGEERVESNLAYSRVILIGRDWFWLESVWHQHCRLQNEAILVSPLGWQSRDVSETAREREIKVHYRSLQRAVPKGHVQSYY